MKPTRRTPGPRRESLDITALVDGEARQWMDEHEVVSQ